jgi:cell wall-associated NlpC family hydrolase
VCDTSITVISTEARRERLMDAMSTLHEHLQNYRRTATALLIAFAASLLLASSPVRAEVSPPPALWAEASDAADAASAASKARNKIIKRAKSWLRANGGHGVPYSIQNTYKGYRADCSGFVSMAWGLRKPGLDTTSLPSAARRVSKKELRKGDILLNRAPGASGHVVLFEKWGNKEHTKYWGFEQSPGGTKRRVIPYPYFRGFGTFEPYRHKRIH